MKPNNLIPLLAVVLMAIGTALFTALVLCEMIAPGYGGREEFAAAPKDRPLLETTKQVWEAETTGTASFHFDGRYYVIENLPSEYVKYSNWYCRMP